MLRPVRRCKEVPGTYATERENWPQFGRSGIGKSPALFRISCSFLLSIDAWLPVKRE